MPQSHYRSKEAARRIWDLRWGRRCQGQNGEPQEGGGIPLVKKEKFEQERRRRCCGRRRRRGRRWHQLQETGVNAWATWSTTRGIGKNRRYIIPVLWDCWYSWDSAKSPSSSSWSLRVLLGWGWEGTSRWVWEDCAEWDSLIEYGTKRFTPLWPPLLCPLFDEDARRGLDGVGETGRVLDLVGRGIVGRMTRNRKWGCERFSEILCWTFWHHTVKPGLWTYYISTTCTHCIICHSNYACCASAPKSHSDLIWYHPCTFLTTASPVTYSENVLCSWRHFFGWWSGEGNLKKKRGRNRRFDGSTSKEERWARLTLLQL